MCGMFGVRRRRFVAPEKSALDEQQGGAAAVAAVVFLTHATNVSCCFASHATELQRKRFAQALSCLDLSAGATQIPG